ncbi:MAG: hypothetical protein SF069_12240 [Phycisphaerae bacterium]|nr:hypothetical protein [Phycisphaerae bacterium]
MLQTPLNTLLFWIMIALGAALLAPCLLLPPWFEYQAVRQLGEQRAARVEELRQQLKALEQQNKFRDDPAYLERLAREEFGIGLTDAQTHRIRPEALEQAAAVVATLEPDSQPAAVSAAAELAAKIDELVQSHPEMRLFVAPRTRSIFMVLGGSTLLVALVLLCRQLPETE